MIDKKYVYELQELETFKGMLRLDLYITFTYFNAGSNDEENQYDLINLSDLSHLMTQSMVELFSREYSIDTEKLKNIEAKDFYISSIPVFNCKKPKLFLIFRHNKKNIMITELKHENKSEIKIRDISKELLISLVLNVHQTCLHLINDVIKKCRIAGKLSVVEADCSECADEHESPETHEENITPSVKNKFDVKNYDKLN